MAVHDIRDMIPKTDQTNPSKFPPYEFREYPKMMTMLADKAYVDDWMERNAKTDDRTGKIVYPGARPRLGMPVPILDESKASFVVYDKDEEAAFRVDHPEALTATAMADPAKDALERRNADLEAQLAALKAKLGATPAKTQAAPAVPSKAAVKPKAKTKGGKPSLPKTLD